MFLLCVYWCYFLLPYFVQCSFVLRLVRCGSGGGGGGENEAYIKLGCATIIQRTFFSGRIFSPCIFLQLP